MITDFNFPSVKKKCLVNCFYTCKHDTQKSVYASMRERQREQEVVRGALIFFSDYISLLPSSVS